MTFRFATGLPLLVIGLLLLLTGAFTIAVYARYQLPAPWKRILPVLRGSVLVLLVLALMEPVMSRVQEVREEAHIAVIMDTSKSMNCVDAWTDEELLETANALGQLKTHDLIATFERAEEALEAARLLAQVDSFDLQRLGEQLDVFEQAVPSPGALAYVQPDQPDSSGDSFIDQGAARLHWNPRTGMDDRLLTRAAEMAERMAAGMVTSAPAVATSKRPRAEE